MDAFDQLFGSALVSVQALAWSLKPQHLASLKMFLSCTFLYLPIYNWSACDPFAIGFTLCPDSAALIVAGY